MRGIVFPGDGVVEIMEFPDPTPGDDEVVLEVKASGMCGSDLHHLRRKKGGVSLTGALTNAVPVIEGHEPCGVVVAAGRSVPKIGPATVGTRVMVHHYFGCTTCNHCRSGWTQLCQEVPLKIYGNNAHGAHARYMKVPASTLVPLPDELSFEAGAAISCGTGTAYGALRRLAVSGRDTVAIFGQGPVGLSATLLAKAMGATVITLDVNEERLERAKLFGADHLIDPTQVDAVAAIRDLTRGQLSDKTLDASGSASGRISAIRSTKIWGAMCFVGEGGDVTINVSADIMRKQLTLLSSWTFSTVVQAECAKFVAKRALDIDGLFTDRWRIEDGVQAYAEFQKQAGGKGVFLP
ncbi:zinc-dependent alcohol dehydrogenase family protein [Marinivivus vitaminiproducens]|uniref:zinc-dependent alcohol dehydrogenase family protein n=1 Tax=Marinivivus vitaminiproducens TaxID=3035935 RepID=UPI00279A9BBC|nr:zinc-binding dehydrogenase [Geminicoccaceae bacterium SCSIO 64248]